MSNINQNADMRKIIEALQRELTSIKTDSLLLKEENSQLKAQLMAYQVQGHKKLRVSPALEDHASVVAIAKQWTHLGSPWIKDSSIGVEPDLSIDPESLARYDSLQTYHEGQPTELWRFVGPKHQDALVNNPDFGQVFKHNVGAGRSTSIGYVRGVAHNIWTNCGYPSIPHTLWITGNGNERKTSEHMLQFLKYDIASDKYPPFMPILYPDLQLVPSKMFRNPILPEILRVCFFGPESVKTEQIQNKTLGKMWGLTSVNGAAIAFAAIIAIFLVSPDEAMRTTGAASKIPYSMLHYTFKLQFIKNAGKSHLTSLIKWYNSRVFRGTGIAIAASEESNNDDGWESALTEAMGDSFGPDSDEESEPVLLPPSPLSPCTSICDADDPFNSNSDAIDEGDTPYAPEADTLEDQSSALTSLPLPPRQSLPPIPPSQQLSATASCTSNSTPNDSEPTTGFAQTGRGVAPKRGGRGRTPGNGRGRAAGRNVSQTIANPNPMNVDDGVVNQPVTAVRRSRRVVSGQ